MKKTDSVVLGIYTALAALSWYWLRNLYLDDPYITFRVARNLAEGHGLVFNVNQRYLATSGPGYALFLALLARLTSVSFIPAIAAALSALALPIIGFGLYRTAQVREQGPSGFIAGLLFVISPFVVQTYLNEILPEIALIVWAFYWLFEPRMPKPTLAVVVLAAATVCRPDGFLACVVALIATIAKHRRIPWTQIAVYAAILVPLAATSRWYYGSVLPPTMGAKIAQVQGGINMDFVAGLTGFIQQTQPLLDLMRVHPIESGLAALVCILPRRQWFWWPLLAWSAAHLAFYAVVGIAYYPWYATPLALILSIGIGAVFCNLWGWLTSGRNAVAMAALLGLAVVYFGAYSPFWERNKETFIPAFAGSVAYLFDVIGLALASLVVIGLRLLVGSVRAIPEGRHLWVARTLRLGLSSAVVVLGASQFTTFKRMCASITHEELDRRSAYQEIGRWLEAHEENKSVGHFEIGIIGWDAPDVTLVDPCGLCTPGMASFVRNGDLWFGAYREYRPDLILVGTKLTRMKVDDKPKGWLAWFHANYRFLTRQGTAHDPFEIYARRNL